MWTAGGAGGSGFGGQSDPGALAQQYWSALTEAMRSAGGGARQQDPWQAAMQQWSQLAGGGQNRNDAGDAIERFSAQARQWFGTMQQVAEQFAGKSASAQDIAAAWKQAMGGGGNPFTSLLSGMTGRGQSGFEDWYAQIAPMFNGMFNGLSGGNMLGGMRQEAMSWLHTPAFGHNREQQERWQALIAAQLELQQKNDAYNALMLEAGRDAFDRFERKLAERSEPGRQLQSARALFDLWIDAAEEAYAEIALSAGFRKVYGELVNAQMRVRAGIQGEVERMCGMFGMPGRTEVDSAHRKIAELERQLRRLRDAVSAQAKPAPLKAAPAKSASEKSVSAEVAKAEPVPKQAIRGKPSPAKAAKKAPAKKAPVNKTRISRAAVKPVVKKAQRQAIAAIAMPEPLKPMPAKRSASVKTAAAKTAKRTR
jgi:class III poly(R)-hydroxyalkanoic acid synthase PhaE subunit